MVVDWEQETGLLMSSGDVRIVRIWDTDRETKVQVTTVGPTSTWSLCAPSPCPRLSTLPLHRTDPCSESQDPGLQGKRSLCLSQPSREADGQDGACCWARTSRPASEANYNPGCTLIMAPDPVLQHN